MRFITIQSSYKYYNVNLLPNDRALTLQLNYKISKTIRKKNKYFFATKLLEIFALT